jgi:hypothetical protein
MIEVVTVRQIRDEARLLEAGAASAGLASLRYVLFDRSHFPCPPGVHVVLAGISREFAARAVELRRLVMPRTDA